MVSAEFAIDVGVRERGFRSFEELMECYWQSGLYDDFCDLVGMLKDSDGSEPNKLSHLRGKLFEGIGFLKLRSDILLGGERRRFLLGGREDVGKMEFMTTEEVSRWLNSHQTICPESRLGGGPKGAERLDGCVSPDGMVLVDGLPRIVIEMTIDRLKWDDNKRRFEKKLWRWFETKRLHAEWFGETSCVWVVPEDGMTDHKFDNRTADVREEAWKMGVGLDLRLYRLPVTRGQISEQVEKVYGAS